MASSYSSPALQLFLILPALLLLLTMNADSVDAQSMFVGNSVTTGSLRRGQYLAAGGSRLELTHMCNLVFWHRGNLLWQSNTYATHFSCSLSVSSQGQLKVYDIYTDAILWTSPSISPETGLFAGLLRPDGNFTIYGPARWSTGIQKTGLSEPQDLETEKVNDTAAELSPDPEAPNVLFPSQVLRSGDWLISENRSSTINKFELTDDCNLVYKRTNGEILWQSGTQGNGPNCLLRLNMRGQLAVVDDDNRIVWSSSYSAPSPTGDFIFALTRYPLDAHIYGPSVWSIPVTTSSSHHNQAGKIDMVTVE